MPRSGRVEHDQTAFLFWLVGSEWAPILMWGLVTQARAPRIRTVQAAQMHQSNALWAEHRSGLTASGWPNHYSAGSTAACHVRSSMFDIASERRQQALSDAMLQDNDRRYCTKQFPLRLVLSLSQSIAPTSFYRHSRSFNLRPTNSWSKACLPLPRS